MRKHKDKQTEKISNQKAQLKEQVKTDNNYIATVEKWEKEKAAAIKKSEADAKAKNPKASKKEITEMIQADKSAVQSAFTDKVNLLKEELTEKYFWQNKPRWTTTLFLAIAEDIGYDATGRSTNNNELIEIAKELSKFIAHINKTEK